MLGLFPTWVIRYVAHTQSRFGHPWPIATKTKKTAMTRYTKFNESWSCSLQSCTTPSV